MKGYLFIQNLLSWEPNIIVPAGKLYIPGIKLRLNGGLKKKIKEFNESEFEYVISYDTNKFKEIELDDELVKKVLSMRTELTQTRKNLDDSIDDLFSGIKLEVKV